MEPIRKTIIANAAAVLCAGFIVIGGTVAARSHSPNPVLHATLRQYGEDEGFSILKRMLEADASTTIEGDQRTTIYGDNGRQTTSTQHVLRDGSRGLRIIYSSPPKMAGTTFVDDGTTLWKFNPRLNRVDQSGSKLKKRIARYPAIMRDRGQRLLNVSIKGPDTVAGRPCTIIVVDRKRDTGLIRRFWVDNATGVQLAMEVQERSGTLKSKTEFTQIAFNVSVPPGSFSQPATSQTATVDPPTGGSSANSLQSASAQAGFPLLSPGPLPPGYKFQSAQVTVFEKRMKMVHARYLNGLDTLSIFQRLDSGRDSDVTFPERGVATRIVSGHRIVVIGSLGNVELRRILMSMH